MKPKALRIQVLEFADADVSKVRFDADQTKKIVDAKGEWVMALDAGGVSRVARVPKS